MGTRHEFSLNDTPGVSDRGYAIAHFDWSNGELCLRMVKRDTWGRIITDTRDSTMNIHHAARWESRQAAAQWLRRYRSKPFGEAWRVVNLEMLFAPRQ